MPETTFDWKGEHQVEFAIALWDHLERNDLAGTHSITVYMGFAGPARNMEIVRATVYRGDSWHIDASGEMTSQSLDLLCQEWVAKIGTETGFHRDDVTYEMEAYTTSEQLRAEFHQLGIQINQDAVILAMRELEEESES